MQKLFFSDVEEEIKNAKTCIHMVFYIWESGGEVEKVENALIAASKRGVKVKILIDGVGSAGFRRSKTRRK